MWTCKISDSMLGLNAAWPVKTANKKWKTGKRKTRDSNTNKGIWKTGNGNETARNGKRTVKNKETKTKNVRWEMANKGNASNSQMRKNRKQDLLLGHHSLLLDHEVEV